jgi:16S rRNA (guanine(966)-N(2))-methyltransferase RsmD
MNILKPHLTGATILDLCSGTGSLGLEALSQGGNAVILVDQDLRYIDENVRNITTKYPDFRQKIQRYKSPLERFLKRNKQTADIIFLDPPWDHHTLYDVALKHIAEFDILVPGGILICEHHKSRVLDLPKPLEIIQVYSYGDTQVTKISR